MQLQLFFLVFNDKITLIEACLKEFAQTLLNICDISKNTAEQYNLISRSLLISISAAKLWICLHMFLVVFSKF